MPLLCPTVLDHAELASSTFSVESYSFPTPFGHMLTAGSAPRLAPAAMAALEPWRLVGDDLGVRDVLMTDTNAPTSGSAHSHGPPPPVPAAATQLVPPAPGIAEHLAQHAPPRIPIWCSPPCHWCCLNVSPEDHGCLHKAHEAYVAMLSISLANDTTPPETKTILMNAMKQVLWACAWHTKTCNETAANRTAYQQLQGMGWFPPDNLPSTPGMGGGTASASAAEPAEQAASTGNAGSTRKKRTKMRKWWEDAADAEWRKEPWVVHDVERTRTIKVMLDGHEYVPLESDVVQTLLTWYDKGHLGDEIKGVKCKVNDRAYDYKIEGGKYLTQNNPNYPDSKPRPCMILYDGAAEPASTWEAAHDDGWWSSA